MKYLLITLIIVGSYSVFTDRYIEGCDSIDPELLEQCGFVEHNGRYIGTYSAYDIFDNYCGEKTIIIEPSMYWVSL